MDVRQQMGFLLLGKGGVVLCREPSVPMYRGKGVFLVRQVLP